MMLTDLSPIKCLATERSTTVMSIQESTRKRRDTPSLPSVRIKRRWRRL